MESNHEFRELHRAEHDVAHFIVEDTFNNRIWRFEMDEISAMGALLKDPDEGPSHATVHLVGAVEDMTDAFVKEERFPRNWSKPTRDRKWGPPDGKGGFGGIDFPPGTELR